MKTFNNLGLAEALLRAVSAEGYVTPTPIQSKVVPAMLAERDVIGIAQTGTGKTAAFVLPLLHRIAREGSAPKAKRCKVLILAPTRELTSQIADSIRAYGRFVRHSATVVIGGARPGPQIRALAPGVDIVVATPGRLLDHLSTGAVRLDDATTVILDEADQMLDLGFMPAIRRIMAKLPAQRQTVLLSATMPQQIRALANDFLRDPLEVSVAPAATPIDRIDQKVMHVDAAAKGGVLVGLLAGPQVERAIVFTRTKRGADKVSRHLQTAGLAADAIHGNKSQNQRERTLARFKAGRVTVLVATDIAARGIDIDDVSHVVNYELPNVPESYVHRIGRTARAGKSGVAVSLCDHSERKLLRDIERLIGSPLKTTSGAAPRPLASRPAAPAGERPKAARPHRPAKPAQTVERKPGNDKADAGLTRMLGNIGGKGKRPAGRRANRAA